MYNLENSSFFFSSSGGNDEGTANIFRKPIMRELSKYHETAIVLSNYRWFLIFQHYLPAAAVVHAHRNQRSQGTGFSNLTNIVSINLLFIEYTTVFI